MKTETMTPRWVVENFLPDYEKRAQKFLAPIRQIKGVTYRSHKREAILSLEGFYDKHFPEALSELLKAQKQQCADEVKAMIEMEDPHCPLDSPMYVGDEEVVIDFILAADFPEPKNRK